MVGTENCRRPNHWIVHLVAFEAMSIGGHDVARPLAAVTRTITMEKDGGWSIWSIWVA